MPFSMYNDFNNYNSFTSDLDYHGFNSGNRPQYRSQALTDAYTRKLRGTQDALDIDNKVADELPKNRSFLDRVFDGLQVFNYASAGFVDGFSEMQKSDEFDPGRPWRGLWDGIKAGNPFGSGFEEGETTYSDVLETWGWQPESTAGKIGKGTVGFVGDVLLDPSTYLTGGLSAGLKGTGKVGATARTLEGLGKSIDDGSLYSSEIARLSKGGEVTEDMVQQAQRTTQAFRESGKNGMTQEMAEVVIRKRIADGSNLVSGDISSSATQLAKEFNRALGIRNEGRISWGIGNLPFMPRKYRDKVIDLGSDAGLRRLSDKLGVSRGYSAVRGFVYGSQIGKMFSSTSPLYRMAKDDPSKLWETLEYSNIVRGMNVSANEQRRMIHERFKSFNLTPAENKEMMSLLQNKTVWSKIAEKTKFANFEVTKKATNVLQEEIEAQRRTLNDMLDKQENINTFQKAFDEDMFDNEELLDVMQTRYHEDLINFDTNFAKSESDVRNLMKTYEDEITKLDSLIAKSESDESAEAIGELFLRHTDERQAHNEYMSTTRVETPEYDGVQHPASREADFESGRIAKNADAPGKSNTHKLIDGLSHHIYGENDMLSPTLRDSDIRALVERVTDGDSVESIRTFIARHPEKYSPHAQDVNSFVGSELGYREWDSIDDPNSYRSGMAKLLGKDKETARNLSMNDMELEFTRRLQDQSFSPTEMKEAMRLKKLQHDRQVMRTQYTNMSPEEFTTFRSALENRKMMEDIGVTEDGKWLDPTRQTFEDMQSSRRRGTTRKRGAEKFDDEFSLFGKESDVVSVDPYQQMARLTDNERTEAMLDLVSANIIPAEQVHDALQNGGNFYRYLNRLIDEVDEFASKNFERRYSSLTDGQKSLALRASAGKLLNKNDGISQGVERVANRKAYEQTIKSIEKEVSIGHELRFNHPTEKSLYRGVVTAVNRTDAGGLEYSLRVPTSGEIIEGVTPNLVRNVKKNKQNLSPQDLLKADVTEVELARKDLLTKQLRDTTAKLDGITDEYRATRETMVKQWEERLAEQRKVMEDLEGQNKTLEELKLEVDEDRILNLQQRIANGEEFINDAEAMETYIRSSEAFGDAVRQEEGEIANAGRVWLEDIASSEKVANTVTELRKSFDEIGQREVDAGIISKEQFEGLLNEYVPHILEKGIDSRSFFKAYRQSGKDKAPVTRDFGYGVKYNPHSQSRTIKGKTIEEINKHFESALKGKNLFQENIADIYKQRAMTHVDAMYDDHYMRNMLETFGRDYKPGGKVEEGYKVVMNHGMLKETIHDISSMNVSTEISRSVSEFLTENITRFRTMAQQSGRNPDEFISAQIDEFISSTYNDDVIRNMFNSKLAEAKRSSGVPNGIFEDHAMPMTEMTAKQSDNILNTFQEAYNNQNDILKRSIERLQHEGAGEAEFQRVFERLDKLDKRTPPQIKQVNENIVLKANQARKIQQTKDQHAMLRLYDKFTHLVKLNQNIVVPSFHTRNKMGNMFQNWLGTGRDAVNINYQTAGTLLAHHKGDVDEINRLIQKGGKVAEALEGVRIPQAHESLAPYMTDGKLEWADLYRISLDYGGIDEGFAAIDIGAQASSKGIMRGSKYDPTNTDGFALYKAGTKVGDLVENGDRLVHVMSRLKQGDSIEDAVASSRKYLFDYSDLTMFEKNVMKRIFPYYTWLRKNARLQVDQLIEKPEKYRTIAKVINGIEGMNNEEDLMNEAFVSPFAQDWVQTPFTSTKDEAIYDEETGELIKPEVLEPILLSPNLPYLDFNRIPDPTQPIDSAIGLFTQTNPLIKNPVELMTNTNAFFGDDIAREEESKVLENTKHLASQLGLYNVAEGMVNKEGIDLALHAVNSATGVKTLAYDYDVSKNMTISEFFENGGEIDGENYQEVIDKINKNINRLRNDGTDFGKQLDRFMRMREERSSR